MIESVAGKGVIGRRLDLTAGASKTLLGCGAHPRDRFQYWPVKR
jgi:hypothetical protein